MEELVKKEPVTPSPNTTTSSKLVTLDARKAFRSSMKEKPAVSSPTPRKLVVLDIHTASSSSNRTSLESEKEIEKLENQFRGLEVNRLHQPTPTTLTKNWYPRPTPPDLQFEEMNGHQFSVSSGKLYEWNIDGLAEQEILNKIQHMTMVANNYVNEGRSHTEVVELLALGFTGKLLQWWNNCLTEESKEDIKYAIQKDEKGLPIFDDSRGKGVPQNIC